MNSNVDSSKYGDMIKANRESSKLKDVNKGFIPFSANEECFSTPHTVLAKGVSWPFENKQVTLQKSKGE